MSYVFHWFTFSALWRIRCMGVREGIVEPVRRLNNPSEK